MIHETAAGPLEKFSSFDSQPRTRIVFGDNAVQRVGELAREIHARRVLVVTDPGIAAAGHADLVSQSLEAAGLFVELFTRARENPTTHSVEECLEAARSAAVDTLVGLGGGSAMDTAKGCNFLLTNGGKMQDYRGVGKATRPMLPLIAIPTTAGTGSECQSAALIVDEATHQKMACLDPKAAARIAILDPVLTLSQPAGVTARTGIDAIAHAVETAVTRRRNPLSSMYSREAFRLCAGAFPEVLAHPENLEARGRMLFGAALAGLAIENSMLGAAHAAANPLTAHFGILHGEAVGLMLPHVVRFNSREPESRAAYELLLQTANSWPAADQAPSEDLAACVENFLAAASLPRSLKERDVPESAIPKLAAEAAEQWTATFNPVAISREDFARLYRDALADSEGAGVER